MIDHSLSSKSLISCNF